MRYDHTLETPRLVIRSWTPSETDRDALHFFQSDPKIRHFFPNRRNREESDCFLEKVTQMACENGFGWAAVCLKGRDRPIGFSGLSLFDVDGAEFSPVVEIGWQFDPAFWGNGYASEAATELLRHGFEDLALPKIVAFAVPDNIRSIAIMKRIGMREVVNAAFDHPMVPSSHPHLKRHVFYEITADQWRKDHGPACT